MLGFLVKTAFGLLFLTVGCTNWHFLLPAKISTRMSHRNHLMLIEFHLRFNLIFPPVNIIGPSDDFFTSNYTIFIALSVPISGIVEIGLILTKWHSGCHVNNKFRLLRTTLLLFIKSRKPNIIMTTGITSHIGWNLPICVKSMPNSGGLQLQND